MEQQQLLTMAETVGQSLVSYVSQELESMDLYFSALEQEEMKEQDAPDKTPAADTWNERGTKQYHAAPSDNKENDSRQTEVPDKLPVRGTAGVNSAGAIYAVEYFLRQNTDLYDAMVCFDSGGQSICRSGTMDFSPGRWGQISQGYWRQMIPDQRTHIIPGQCPQIISGQLTHIIPEHQAHMTGPSSVASHCAPEDGIRCLFPAVFPWEAIPIRLYMP